MFQLVSLGNDIDLVDDVSYDPVHELVVLTVRLSDVEQGSGTRTRQTKGNMAYLRTRHVSMSNASRTLRCE